LHSCVNPEFLMYMQQLVLYVVRPGNLVYVFNDVFRCKE